MATVVWGAGSGGGTDGLYSTASNWTADTKPTSVDDVSFDGVVDFDCRLDEAVNVLSMTSVAGYTGTIDAATDDLNHAVAGDLVLANARVELGDGIWSLGGVIDLSGVASLVQGLSMVRHVGTSGTPTIDIGVKNLHNIDVDNAGVTDFIVSANLAVSGTIHVISGKFNDNGKNISAVTAMLIDNVADMVTSTGLWIIIQAGVTISNPHPSNRLATLFTTLWADVTQVGDVYAGVVQLGGAAFSQGAFTLYHSDNFVVSSSTVFNGDTGKLVCDASSGTPVITPNAFTTLNDFEVNNAGVTSFKTTAKLVITGNVNLAAGKFDLDGNIIDFDKNWTEAPAFTFTDASGIANLTSSSAMLFTGNTSFNDLRCSVGAKQISCVSGDRVTAATLTLAGTAVSPIVLRAATSGVHWELEVTGESSVDYVDVKDCDASSGTWIYARSSVSSGNNTFWSFNNPKVHSVEVEVASAVSFPPKVHSVEVEVGEKFGIRAVGIELGSNVYFPNKIMAAGVEVDSNTFYVPMIAGAGIEIDDTVDPIFPDDGFGDRERKTRASAGAVFRGVRGDKVY